MVAQQALQAEHDRRPSIIPRNVGELAKRLPLASVANCLLRIFKPTHLDVPNSSLRRNNLHERHQIRALEEK
jgi:hypothetical protein